MLYALAEPGLMAMERAIEIDAVLRRAPLPALELDPLKLIDAIARDKKRRAGELRWVLLEDVGRPVVTSEVESTDVKSVAQWLCEIAREGSPIAMPPLRRPRIVILNGPNLNLTGSRERDVYGTESLAELEDQIRRHAERVGVDVLIRQSNSEGELVSLIQYARHWADGLAINPGGYTHTSVAIRDAIAAVGIPTVEVHLSDIAAREEFRRESLIAPVCKLQIAGKGFAGYLDAIDSLL